MLEISNLTKRYGRTAAVEDLSIQARPGEVLALLGPNGAGKTTTIRCTVGLASPTSGTIRVGGKDARRDPLAVKRAIGFVPDRAWFYPKVTALELLRYVAGVRKVAQPAARIDELLQRFRIADYANNLIESYSHGMRQRLAFCAALVGEPDLFIVDEPMVGLDVQGHRDVKLLFREIAHAAIPVPSQQFKDVLGTMNIAFIGFLLAGVALRIAFPSVSFEGSSFWLTQVSPVRKRDLVIARFLFSLPIMLALGLALGLAARFVLDLSPTLALAAPLAAGSSALAMTGLAVGMGASFPKFDYTNPNELVMTPGAIAFMAVAIAHGALTATLFARPAWVTLSGSSGGSYWSSAEGLVILGLLLLLTAVTTLLPLLHGTRQLHRSEF